MASLQVKERLLGFALFMLFVRRACFFSRVKRSELYEGRRADGGGKETSLCSTYNVRENSNMLLHTPTAKKKGRERKTDGDSHAAP